MVEKDMNAKMGGQDDAPAWYKTLKRHVGKWLLTRFNEIKEFNFES